MISTMHRVTLAVDNKRFRVTLIKILLFVFTAMVLLSFAIFFWIQFSKKNISFKFRTKCLFNILYSIIIIIMNHWKYLISIVTPISLYQFKQALIEPS